MRARHPDRDGIVENDGVKLRYEVFDPPTGAAPGPTILLLPTWTIVHSRFWKSQVPDLARRWRVVTYDGPGNGGSDRPTDPRAYTQEAQVAGALRVLDAAAAGSPVVVVSLSRAANWALDLAANHADRVAGVVFVAPALRIGPAHPERAAAARRFGDRIEAPEGWQRLNAHHWRRDWPDFAEFFFAQCFSEPHSTKQHEDAVGWALQTTPDVMLAEAAATPPGADTLLDWCEQVTCPALVIHGDDDQVIPHQVGQVLADRLGCDLALLAGAGHIPPARDPVRVNLLLREFVEDLGPPRAASRRPWTRGRSRRRRALFISSPIGLGHARRDVAIAQELRRHHPDLEIEWLAQHPVTRVLQDSGEVVHPASAELANETAHLESESGEHDLHCFQAWRRMDEILLADFMVFHDVVTARDYDLVIGDEAWDVDYFLHENPELKRFGYAWLTDFVGFLPMPDGGDREARLTADYNAEMIEHIARYPRIRDAALFVGDPDDIVPDDFGPGLPRIRDWTQTHYDFAGYVTGFDPVAVGDREQHRQRLGYRPDEQVCVVTVGGSGVGADLLDLAVRAFPEARRQTPDLRMIVVAGPRIDPDRYPTGDGLEIRGYVPDLHQQLMACDLAIVQGGLTTCMELTTSQRPFVYVPLRHHFEQNFHVDHRLRRHRAGRRLDYGTATPDEVAAAIKAEIGREVTYRPVDTGGAARAAAMLAELL